MKTRMRLATVTALLVLTIMSSASQSWADQQTRLRARKNKVVNGIEAELRGDYRENNSPIRLNSELEQINIPAGTPVAFCLVQDGVSTLLGVGRVVLIGGVQVASVELEASDGDVVPKVSAGDVLQARQRSVAPFNPKPGCGAALLVSAPFQK